MVNKPLVSFVVPCYNQGVFLNATLQSVYDQDYTDWECLIVDDGSGDNTSQIAKSWTAKDERYKYFHQENRGLASARNLGLNKASGNFIQFLDSDDFLDKSKLLLSLKVFEKNDKVKIVISNYLNFNTFTNSLEKPHFPIKEKLLNYKGILLKWDHNFAVPIHCGLFSSTLFEDFRFPEDLKAKEDWVMWVKFFQKQILVEYIEIPLAYYRRHESNMTNNLNMTSDHIKALKYIKEIISQEDYFDLLELKVERLSNTIFSLREQIKVLKSNFGWKVYYRMLKIFNKQE